MKAQTRRGAAIETGVNLFVGFALSFLINLLCLPLFGMQPSHGALWGLGAIFTLASIVRQFVLRRFFEWLRIRKAPPEFLYIAEELAAERHRQISGEGYDLAHDDAHHHAEIARGACAYAYIASTYQNRSLERRIWISRALQFWPWGEETFRPTNPRRDLVKAGAMVIAEIGRLDRANGRPQ